MSTRRTDSMSWKSRLTSLVAIDVRAFALFRISLGLILLCDLGVRLQDFAAMYTEGGFLPISRAAAYHDDWRWSLHLLSGADLWQGALFAVAAVAAAALLVGYRARLAVILCWVLIVSLHVRMPLVLNAGDSLLRLLLFWSMFLPLGRIWSFDARRNPRAARGDVVASVPTAAILLQICILYWYSGLSKLNDVWLGGLAMDHVLRYSMLVRPLADELLQYPALLRAVTESTLLLEIAGPFLLFIPWRVAAVRMGAVVIFATFHLGVQLSFHLGLFSFVALSAWILLLPAAFWDACTGVFAVQLRRWWPGVAAAGSANGTVPPATGTPAPSRRVGLAVDVLCLLFLSYVVASWDFTTLRYRQMPDWLKPIGNITMLPQAWGMFQTAIPRDYWYIYKGTLASGELVDILEEGVLTSFEKADRRSEAFPNHRWRKTHGRLVDSKYDAYRQPLVEHLFERWNSGQEEERKLNVLEMFLVTEVVGSGVTDNRRAIAPLARVSDRQL